MSFYQISRQPIDPDEQSTGTGPAPLGKADQLPGLPQDSSEKMAGYITYAEMQELQHEIGELLHRILDFCLTVTMGPQETSQN